MEDPPAFDPGAVVDEDALTDGQGAVIPDQQEVEGSVCHPGVEEEAAGEGDENEDDGEVELELLVLVFVGKLSLLAQECHVDVAQNQAQIQPILLGQVGLHIEKEALSLLDLVFQLPRGFLGLRREGGLHFLRTRASSWSLFFCQ